MYACELEIGVISKILARKPFFRWVFIEIPSQMLFRVLGVCLFLALIQYTEHRVLVGNLVPHSSSCELQSTHGSGCWKVPVRGL